jgi:F0F1-type ATP synthase assembly protein I
MIKCLLTSPNRLTRSLLPNKDKPDPLHTPAAHDSLHDPLQMGITIVGVTIVFGGIGWWLDRRLHTFPILLVIGAVVGLTGIIYTMAKRLRASDRLNEELESESKRPKDK